MKRIRVITHSNSFHVDEIFAIATLKLWLKVSKKYFGNFLCRRMKIIRTRDLSLIREGDFVIDVGSENDHKRLRFDHHQVGGAGKRLNGVQYASFGLLWKKYGEIICGSKEVFTRIDKKMVQSIDAMDNGVDLFENVYKDISPYLFYDIVATFDFLSKRVGDNSMKGFLKMIDLAEDILRKEIQRSVIEVREEKRVEEIYKSSEEKSFLVFDKGYDKFSILNILGKYKEVLFFIKPDTGRDNAWEIRAIRDDINSFKNRKDFPVEWAGKKDNDLVRATGVRGAIFCHLKRYLVIAKTKEGAIELTKLALKNNN
ncbi:MAG: MYG1 family protein [Candidatus Pacebacteria bacterium]|nr:MYG1 family protein [Candidatus Paceibacterota bacterium]